MKTRTMQEARDAGQLFSLYDESGRDVGMYPAAETPREAAQFALANEAVNPGQSLNVWRHLPASRIGAQVLEPIGVVVVQSVAPVNEPTCYYERTTERFTVCDGHFRCVCGDKS